MSSIVPTIGRKVWFYDYCQPGDGEKPVGCYDRSVPFDATVIFVWNPSCVNLRVTAHDGSTYVKTSVPLRDAQEGDAHGSYVATWMPYQMRQASKEAAS